MGRHRARLALYLWLAIVALVIGNLWLLVVVVTR